MAMVPNGNSGHIEVQAACVRSAQYDYKRKDFGIRCTSAIAENASVQRQQYSTGTATHATTSRRVGRVGSRPYHQNVAGRATPRASDYTDRRSKVSRGRAGTS